MVRKKVKLAWVENNRARKSTFKKRRESLLKLMTEFTILCDVNGFVIVYAPNNNEPAMWPDRPVVEEIVRRFQNVPEADRRKKMMNQEIYLKERTAKLIEKLRKHQEKNHEMEMREKMHQIENCKAFDAFETSELTSLVFVFKEKMNEIKRRMDYSEDGGDADQNMNQIGGNKWMSDMVELAPYTYFGSSFGVNEMELPGGNPYGGSHDLELPNPIDHNKNIGPSSSVRTDMEQQPPHTYFGSTFNAANYIRVPIENFAGSCVGLPYGHGSQYENVMKWPPNYGGIPGGSETNLMMPYSGNTGWNIVEGNIDGMGHQLPHHGLIRGDPGSDMQLPPGLFGGNNGGSDAAGLPPGLLGASNGGTDVGLSYDVSKTFQSSFSP